MGFLNSAIGRIKTAIVFDETGRSLPQVLEIARAMAPDSILYCLLLPNIHTLPFAVTGMLAKSTSKVPPFNVDLTEKEIRYLLDPVNPGRDYNLEQLFKSIFPADVYSRMIIRCISKRNKPLTRTGLIEKFLNGIDINWKLLEPNFFPIVDYAIPTTSSSLNVLPELTYAGPYEEDFTKLLGNKFKVLSASISDREIFIKPGDIVAGEGFLLLGIRSYLNYKEIVKKASKEDFIKYIIGKWYKNSTPPAVYIIGNETEIEFSADENFYHLDLYLNYAGKYAGEGHVFFLAELQADTINLFAVNTVKKRQLEYLRNQLEAIKDYLPTNCKIIRVPVVVDSRYNIFSFNNCITEIDGVNRKCYMPRYVNLLRGQTSDPKILAPEIDRCFGVFKQNVSPYFAEADIKLIDVDKGLNGESNQALHCFISVLERLPVVQEIVE